MRSLTKLSRSEEGKKPASALMRRFVRKRREDEERRLRALRAEKREKARKRARAKDIARKLRLRKAAAAADKKERMEALAKIPKEFTAEMLGQGHKTGGTRAQCAHREACLERLRLRAPPLSREWEAAWPDFKKDSAISMGVKHKAAVGVRFLEVGSRARCCGGWRPGRFRIFCEESQGAPSKSSNVAGCLRSAFAHSWQSLGGAMLAAGAWLFT